jgi:adenylate cyclase
MVEKRCFSMEATLHVRPAKGEAFQVAIGNTATLGRSRENAVCLHFDPHVSRQHAILRCHNGFSYQIMDLGSRNGTFVDGRRVLRPQELKPGALIKISGVEILFEPVEAEAQAGAEMTLLAGPESNMEESLLVSVMVCDLRGFSTMSEKLGEVEVSQTLGQWFRVAGTVVQDLGGTVDKFLGDAVLAYWIAPAGETGGETEAEQAMAAARQLLQKASLQHWPGAEPKPLRVAVALHRGLVCSGNIGLAAQRDATIIGDTVNTVFRMEALMKSLGQRVVWTTDFQESLRTPPAEARDLGEHRVKGKNQTVHLFGLDPLPGS